MMAKTSTGRRISMSAQRYWRSAANARGSAATDAFVRCDGGLGGALLVDTSLAPSRVNVSPRRSSPPGEKGCGVGLRLAYRVAQVCNANARDHRRVAKNDWRAGEAVKESNSEPVLGARLGHFERHGVRPSGAEFDVP